MPKLARDLRPVLIALTCLSPLAAVAQVRSDGGTAREVSFPTDDGGRIHALLYGEGDRGVVLAHGRVFDKGSWAPLAPRLVAAGFEVLAIDFRGYGSSQAGAGGNQLHLDVLAAIRYLQDHGAARVSVVGASMGGGAAARAAVEARKGDIDRLVLLAPAAIPDPEEIHAERIAYIVAEGDPALEHSRRQFERAPEPKSLEILPGDAHAQHLFKTEQSEALIRAILEALGE